MHKVAVTATVASSLIKLAASRLPKISHGRELAHKWPACIETAVQSLLRRRSVFLVFVLGIYVADEVVAQVITYIELFQLAKLAQLFKNLFVKILEFFIHLALVERSRVSVLSDHLRDRVLIHVAHQDRLAEHRLIMETGTSVTVSASTNFKVEWTIYAVLFRAMDPSQVLSASATLFATTTAHAFTAKAPATRSAPVPSLIPTSTVATVPTAVSTASAKFVAVPTSH